VRVGGGSGGGGGREGIFFIGLREEVLVKCSRMHKVGVKSKIMLLSSQDVQENITFTGKLQLACKKMESLA
jgi:hypothetical protein